MLFTKYTNYINLPAFNFDKFNGTVSVISSVGEKVVLLSPKGFNSDDFYIAKKIILMLPFKSGIGIFAWRVP